MISLIRTLIEGFTHGPECRSCSETIAAGDRFGRSEGVCAPCRS